MVSFAPTSPDTLQDRRLYTEARMVEVSCLDCLAVVRVKKNSEQHTSIQWSDQALHSCAEFHRLEAQGPRHIHQACPRLRGSIERAVAEGRVEIGAQDGY